jgi:nucleoside-diphosphate-sugar epimerase
MSGSGLAGKQARIGRRRLDAWQLPRDEGARRSFVHVLILGGNRFVGRLLAARLLAGGHRVTLLNRGRIPDPFGSRVERLTCDRTAPEFEPLLAGRSFDAAVDLAAYTFDDGRRASELLRGRVGHFLMVSTGQVYLVREGCPRPARERDYDGPLMARPTDPTDLAEWEYGIGKRACEDALAAAEGFPTTRIRIPMVNGPGDYFRRIEGYLWRLWDGGPLLLPDGGTHLVRHVDGAEVARFVCSILGNKETFGQAYNVAQDETPSLAELVAMLRERMGSTAELVAVPRATILSEGLDPVKLSPFSDRWMSFLDPSRSFDELGFRHAPLPEVLAAVVGHFLARPPPDRPPGYAQRATELSLARHL